MLTKALLISSLSNSITSDLIGRSLTVTFSSDSSYDTVGTWSLDLDDDSSVGINFLLETTDATESSSNSTNYLAVSVYARVNGINENLSTIADMLNAANANIYIEYSAQIHAIYTSMPDVAVTRSISGSFTFTPDELRTSQYYGETIINVTALSKSQYTAWYLSNGTAIISIVSAS